MAGTQCNLYHLVLRRVDMFMYCVDGLMGKMLLL